GGDVFAAGSRVKLRAAENGQPLVAAKAGPQLLDARLGRNERRKTAVTTARPAPPFAFALRQPRAPLHAAPAKCRRCARRPANRHRAKAAARARACACGRAVTAAGPRSR